MHMVCYAYDAVYITVCILYFFFYKFHNSQLQILQWTHVVLPLVHQEIIKHIEHGIIKHIEHGIIDQ